MKTVLFDMDGTLTPPRGKINQATVDALVSVQEYGHQIAIVSGSDMNYITEQCDLLFSDRNFDHSQVFWFPCNGTKRYRASGTDMICVYDNNMIEYLGKKDYRRLISACLTMQKYLLEYTIFPVTGHFFDYRGSMLNWCPIGRAAGETDRQEWKNIDSNYKLRKKWRLHLKDELENIGLKDLQVKLGGDTSFDIYPKGWDKTYVLRNFCTEDMLYFVGDKCDDLGNDFELYNAIKARNAAGAFKTNGPGKTITIINECILNQSEQL